MTRKKLLILFPAALFAALMTLAVLPLLRTDLRGALVEDEIPQFSRAEFDSDDLRGQVTLLNFFASWCPPCEAEHPQLLVLKADHGIAIYGINFKDSDSGRRDYLQRLGNPYAAVIPDPKGELAALFGVTGVPETLVIDKDGRIRERIREPITPESVRSTLVPLIRGLR